MLKVNFISVLLTSPEQTGDGVLEDWKFPENLINGVVGITGVGGKFFLIIIAMDEF